MEYKGFTLDKPFYFIDYLGKNFLVKNLYQI